MRSLLVVILCSLFFFALAVSQPDTQGQSGGILKFGFDEGVKNRGYELAGSGFHLANGIDGKAFYLTPEDGYSNLRLKGLSLDGAKDFSVQFWMKTTSVKPTVFLSQKRFTNKGVTAQKNAGWALYGSSGTFAWSIGSGDRRINYERDNGNRMPVNDGYWHQLTVTYSQEQSEFRLYYDGLNKAVYKVGFDFVNNEPLLIGSVETESDYKGRHLAEIESGAIQLQALVDEFNKLGVGSLGPEEFISLIVDPKRLYEEKLKEGDLAVGDSKFKPNSNLLDKALAIRTGLTSNPYTVFQNRALTDLKPISKVYQLQNNKVVIDESAAAYFAASEKLYPSDFALDELCIWEKVISPEEILESYERYRKAEPVKVERNLKELTVGVWNIWHGGIHFAHEKDGWDSRLRIVEMLQKNKVDIVLMQETYSSGDFIAAELGYYFATTSDWDYRFQGSNISVLSRYPVRELAVSKEAEFNNVAVKLALSGTQEIYAMSNWYGMQQFPAVFNFHKSKFDKSDEIPILFGGDFNSVPHTDGGDSPASLKLLAEDFTDAFRSQYPNVSKYPGVTHRSGNRIDQLYYKGDTLDNISTRVVSSWPTGFPSDHFLIVSKFRLGLRD